MACGRVHHGAICRKCSVTGIVSFGGSAGGARTACGIAKFMGMADDPDFEYPIINSTVVRAHQHAAGAKRVGLKIKPSGVRAAA